ncbi:tyrosinase family oxidase copper chaperone [Streptomyces sp. NPDC047706]|uniref:tyrosinase family oxidase copper chaperone n=1 Tax=Streptomyces sp. NPDC047706 TaxID=3365486 RepID=UPI003719039A
MVGGAVAVGVEGSGTTARAGSAPVRGARQDLGWGTRRAVVRGLLASAAVLAVPACDPGGLAGAAPDEMYRGRRIRVSGSRITVDGRPLHLMRRADGTWLSMIDHYCSYPTPLEAARAAVDELGPKGRLPLTEGDHHGVHA